MTRVDLLNELKSACTNLTGQMVDAAHYLILNAEEVPFHSMREVARRAGVQPVSLVRLAQKLGYDGYGPLRERFIDTIPQRTQRDRQSTSRNELSALNLMAEIGPNNSLADFIRSYFAAETAIVEHTCEHISEESVNAAAELLAHAKKIYVLGRRTAFPPAFTISYALHKARPNVIMVDAPGGAPESTLDDILPGDAVVAVTFAPFNRLVHRLAKKAALSGAKVIAITDSFAAPIGEVAGSMHFVAQSSGRAFPESALGAIAVANLLAALTINKLGKAAQDRIRENERYLVSSGEYLLAPSSKWAFDAPEDADN